jgi:hypothetical protein
VGRRGCGYFNRPPFSFHPQQHQAQRPTQFLGPLAGFHQAASIQQVRPNAPAPTPPTFNYPHPGQNFRFRAHDNQYSVTHAVALDSSHAIVGMSTLVSITLM